MSRRFRIFFIGAAFALLGGCSSGTKGKATKPGDSGAETAAEAGPPAPTFTNVFKLVIQGGGCALPQCHGAAKQGGLSLATKPISYTALVGVKAQGPCIKDAGNVEGGLTSAAICGCEPSGKTRVVAGQPDQSLLMEKLATTQTCGEPMPPSGEPLPQDQVDLVKAWILAGANND